MAKKFADVEKIAGAASKIDNAERECAIEPEVLCPFDVDVDPINDVLEAIDPRRAPPVRILFPQLLKLSPIERFENAGAVDWMRTSTEVFERAGEDFGRK